MKKLIALIVIIGLLLLVGYQIHRRQVKSNLKRNYQHLPRQAREILASIDYLRKQYPSSGAVVALYDHGRFYYFTRGDALTRVPLQPSPITHHTIFRLGSLSKVFTSTLLAEDVLNGRVSLHDPVVDYLPPWIKKLNNPINHVTLEELATHTSSLPRILPSDTESVKAEAAWQNNVTPENIYQYVAHWKPSVSIGTKWVYSNLGYALLGLALEHADQKTYDQLLRRRVLRPLRMAHTFAVLPKNQVANLAEPLHPFSSTLVPAGGIFSTSQDMLQFIKANLGVDASPSIVRALQLAHRVYFKNAVPKFADMGKGVVVTLDMGLGWERLRCKNKPTVISKGGENIFFKKVHGTESFGATYLTFVALIPKQKLGIVYLVSNPKYVQSISPILTFFGYHILVDLASR